LSLIIVVDGGKIIIMDALVCVRARVWAGGGGGGGGSLRQSVASSVSVSPLRLTPVFPTYVRTHARTHAHTPQARQMHSRTLVVRRFLVVVVVVRPLPVVAAVLVLVLNAV
jgi:hypothetical protein